jgi:hypothetical protein
MTVTLLIIVFAAAAIALFLGAVRAHRQMARELPQLEDLTQSVDLAAFRNLVDPAEESYLRENLSRPQFRAIQRQRLQAALEYVRRTAHNASLLLRAGEAALRSEDPEIAMAGRELVNHALLLGIRAKLAVPLLYARIALPGAHISVGRVIDVYQRLTEDAVRLARLQNPAYAARITAAI